MKLKMKKKIYLIKMMMKMMIEFNELNNNKAFFYNFINYFK